MEFLVAIHTRLPDHLDDAARTQLLAAESERGTELRRAGVIQRIWRVPGAQRNVGIWEAPDPSTLHAAIASLPLYPWMTAEVTALATHPLEEGGLDG